MNVIPSVIGYDSSIQADVKTLETSALFGISSIYKSVGGFDTLNIYEAEAEK
ncbi:hypothetical protein [Sulfurimonas sp. HSL3-7]|uniref:hypothetical protein n=1 Tax=Sulfonitrofixus jiaomeiensis TaxID=3131938 RepID=UPI0031F738B4